MRATTCFLVGWALAAAAGACGPGPLPLAVPERGYGAGDYSSVLKAWTRSAEDHYSIMEGRLFAAATYWSPAFRSARLSYAESIFGWGGSDRARAEAEDRDDAKRWYTFFLAVSTFDWRWNHLDAEDSIWWLWLEDDAGRRVRATNIKRVRKKRGEYAVFYPHLGSFYEGYLVRFPRPGGPDGTGEGAGPGASALPRIEPGTRSFTLRVVGAPAAIELEWELR